MIVSLTGPSMVHPLDFATTIEVAIDVDGSSIVQGEPTVIHDRVILR